jgi:glucan phosphoethanolaminetransferase (alkaline phosphatase superfamily)
MLQVLLILLVYIVGPVAIVVWAFKRYKHGVKPSFGEVVVVVFAVLLMVLFAVSTNWNVSDRDAAEADQLVAELVKRYDFPVKFKYQDAPAVYAEARARRLVVYVYGVTERQEQDKMVAVAEKLRRQIASKPVVIHFMREEVWEVDENGARRPRRDREELMRKARID